MELITPDFGPGTRAIGPFMAPGTATTVAQASPVNKG